MYAKRTLALPNMVPTVCHNAYEVYKTCYKMYAVTKSVTVWKAPR